MGRLARIAQDGWQGRWSAGAYAAFAALPLFPLAARASLALTASHGTPCAAPEPGTDHGAAIKAKLALGSAP